MQIEERESDMSEDQKEIPALNENETDPGQRLLAGVGH